jgi:hypothetical protein
MFGKRTGTAADHPNQPTRLQGSRPGSGAPGHHRSDAQLPDRRVGMGRSAGSLHPWGDAGVPPSLLCLGARRLAAMACLRNAVSRCIQLYNIN